MTEKLSKGLEEMDNDSTIGLLKYEACVKICENISSMMVVLCSDMGTSDQSISYLSIQELESGSIGRLHCLVIPADPSDVESSALMRWSKK
jgi:diphthamide biosynthesis methyltransferase